MLAVVAIVDIWKCIQSHPVCAKGEQDEVSKLSPGIKAMGSDGNKQYHNTISGSLGSTTGCEQFVQTWEGTCASLCIGNM